MAQDNPLVAHPIIVFDGLCVLCSANAHFVLRFDRQGHFRLTAMQSQVGQALYRRFGIDPTDPDTLIVVTGDTALQNSDAVLAIWAGLGWPWKLLTIARLVAKPIRDRLYRWVARNRYRWFGQRETCWLPTPAQAARIL
jgi:predicted DCC family thiol-disulfide oxidoreductase YuxK